MEQICTNQGNGVELNSNAEPIMCLFNHKGALQTAVCNALHSEGFFFLDK